jgi:FAD/FMN-containing dehydrogenase
MAMTHQWRNWAGTFECTATRLVAASSVGHVAQVLARADEAGTKVRPVGTGHSFSPLVPTDGVVLDVSALSGILDIDTDAQIVRVGAGSTVGSLGAPLWEAGLSLRNQGAIDLQTMAGATGTSTHGSGLRHQAMSGAVVGAEVVTASGDVLHVAVDDPILPALRASMGCLGVVTKLDIKVQPAYKLAETLAYWPLAEVMERWDDENRSHRHFSFVWGPDYDMSSEMPDRPADMEDCTMVRIFDEVDLDTPDSPVTEYRIGPAYTIYPAVYPGPWEEVEYFVPYETTHQVMDAVRPIVEKYPDEWPVEVRTVAADDSWLSPMYGRDSSAIGFCRTFGPDNTSFFHEIDAVMADFGGRPHWGKQPYFLDQETIRGLYPRFDDFVELRRKLDPRGTLLNNFLGPILA